LLQAQALNKEVPMQQVLYHLNPTSLATAHAFPAVPVDPCPRVVEPAGFHADDASVDASHLAAEPLDPLGTVQTIIPSSSFSRTLKLSCKQSSEAAAVAATKFISTLLRRRRLRSTM
jgi:hypothetical protein